MQKKIDEGKFVVEVSLRDWNRMGLDDPIRNFTATAALYNGYGMLQLQRLMTGNMDSAECVDLREVARLLGLDPSTDRIEKSK